MQLLDEQGRYVLDECIGMAGLGPVLGFQRGTHPLRGCLLQLVLTAVPVCIGLLSSAFLGRHALDSLLPGRLNRAEVLGGDPGSHRLPGRSTQLGPLHQPEPLPILFQDPQGRIGLRVLGKGDKERVIRVRDDLLAVLSALHGTGELNAKDRSPLLPSTRGAAYSARGVHKLVAQATEAAGLNKPVSPHWLRHTHATLAAAGGAPAVVIQASLGHARLETSQGYIHWARGLEETTVDSLPHLTKD